MIREIILAGGAFYLLINIVQLVQNQSVGGEGLAVGVIYLIGVGAFWSREEEPLKKWEYLVIWVAVLLFVVYGALHYGGMV
ncbi:hypothetical protein J2741_001802 [Methanolinea mesophila]|uniref:hypothetical protein n=1 Tax=Methanolinea mesophila TaxID=547055 RepID=UPI001AE97703|nr:hypothetical protein [Methanolinea mesophila]MBP1929255.1 hypothetical protein [Methanolinea mesophila]